MARELYGWVAALKDSVYSRKVADEEHLKGEVECSRLDACINILEAKFKEQEQFQKSIDGLINTSTELGRILSEVLNEFEALGSGIKKMEER